MTASSDRRRALQQTSTLGPGGPLWDPQASYQRILLNAIEVDIRVGVSQAEKVGGRTQPIVVNVEMFRHARSHAGETMDQVIDYDRVHRVVAEEWPRRDHTELLETLLEELVALCFEDARVEACRVSIQKPTIYADTAASGVEVYRLRKDHV